MAIRKWFCLSIAFLLAFSIIFPPAGVFAADRQGTVTGDNLNVRAKPSTSSDILGKLHSGDAVQVARQQEEWYQIDYEGSTAYLHSDFVSVESSSSHSQSDSSDSPSIQIFVNGEKISLPFNDPPMVDNHILVPFRAIGESLNISMSWDNEKKQVLATDAGKEVILTIGQSEAVVDGKTVEAKPSPRLKQKRTIIPLRFFAETFGADVTWSQKEKTVTIEREEERETHNNGLGNWFPENNEDDNEDQSRDHEQPDTDVEGAYTGQIVVDDLNVRVGPSDSAQKIGKLHTGDNAEVIGFAGRWAQIDFEGQKGYVHSYYLTLDDRDGKETKILGEPAVEEKENRATIKWPKIGGKVATTEESSDNTTVIETEATMITPVPSDVTGVKEIDYTDEEGKNIEIELEDGYSAVVDHSTGYVTVTILAEGLEGKRIVIDAGHGGHDGGAEGNDLIESETVLDLAERLEKLLSAEDADVMMTRTEDVFLTLSERVQIAEEEQADLFVSIHNNAAHSHANGTETFWYDKYAAAESERLAEALQGGMMDKLDTTDRGVKKGNFHVIRETTMPSSLIEVAFLTNDQDAERIKDPSFRQKAAEGLLDGLKQFYAE